MTPRVTELEKLNVAVKKVLRTFKHMRGIPDGPAPENLIIKARELGLLLTEKPSLQEMLEQTQATIQVEILREFQLRSEDTGLQKPNNDLKRR